MDVRPIPCSVKHGLIIQTWLQLPVGDYFVLLNDHDPVHCIINLPRNGREHLNGNTLSKVRMNFA